MAVFEHPDFDAHESVHFFHDESVGLNAIIAVHSTARGPSAGGTRFWPYPTNDEVITDALRLSRAMSYKNAMADLSLGGGKGVIIKPDGNFDRKALFTAYGRAIETLGGCYLTAEDVGVSPDDMRVIKSQTDYVGGLTEGKAASGDPSPVTADGVFRGLQVAAEHRLGSTDLTGVRVAVQGLGHVGYHLCRLLQQAGAELTVADINKDVIGKAISEFDANVVDPTEIHNTDVDIYAPCALGGAINPDTINDIKAQIVGGAANNQLLSSEMGEALRDRDILYCPDYVINAGGIINIAAEFSGTYDPTWVDQKLETLKATLREVFKIAKLENLSTNKIANRMARARIALGTKSRTA